MSRALLSVQASEKQVAQQGEAELSRPGPTHGHQQHSARPKSVVQLAKEELPRPGLDPSASPSSPVASSAPERAGKPDPPVCCTV